MNSDERHMTVGQRNAEEEFSQMMKKLPHRDPGSGEPRELTAEEVRECLIRHLWGVVRYWADTNSAQMSEKTIEERIAGAIFTALAALDGDSIAIPGFLIIPNSCPEDKEYCKNEGLNWFPAPTLEADIGGGLHEFWHQFDPRKKKESPAKSR